MGNILSDYGWFAGEGNDQGELAGEGNDQGEDQDCTLPHINCDQIIDEGPEPDRDPTEVYKMNTKPRGYCLIINMTQDRPGCEKDANDLKRVFKKLHFKVKIYSDLKEASVIQLLQKVERADYSKLCCFMMFILAHGTTMNNEHVFQTADRKLIRVSDVEEQIRSVENLYDKPKLLFVEPCRGQMYNRGIVTRDSLNDGLDDDDDDNGGTHASLQLVSPASAFLRYSATIKDYVSRRDEPEGGTRFVQSIVEIFGNEQYIKNCDLMDLLTKVTAHMKQKYQHQIIQIPEISRGTLDRKLYFGRRKPKEYLPTRSIMVEYEKKKNTFSITLCGVVDEIYGKKTLEDIKQKLVSYEPRMISEVEVVQNKTALTGLLRKYCFLSNINLLKFLSEVFNLEESQKKLKDLAGDVDKFFATVRAEDFAKAAIEDHKAMENREELIFIMPWNPNTDESTLLEFSHFLREAFGDYSMLISVRTAHQSWLKFECTIPIWSVSLFKGLITKNVFFFKSEGVLRISIGDDTIYSEKSESTFLEDTLQDKSIQFYPHGSNSLMASSSESGTRQQEKQLLNISHLVEVLHLLKKCGYSGTSYYELGLHLGLSPPTLNIIAKDNAGDVNSCLRECLKAWLKQADDVKSNGGPTHYLLIKALRKIEQNAVADGIDKEKHPACVIFIQCEFNQSVMDCLPRLATLLYKEEIVAEMVIPTVKEASSVLLKAVKEAVCADYHNLKKFATILKQSESQPVISVACSLLEDYRKAFADENTITISREHVKITLPLKLSPEFTGMHNKFADLMDDVARAMQSTSCDELKQYVHRAHIHLRPQLAQCHDTDDIIELIGDQCSLINIALLEGIVVRFKVEEAKSAIQHYKDEIESFHQEGRPLRQFLNSELALSSPLQCETATITVNKAVDDYELKDINILMTFAFETLASNVKVVVIREGNSFTICITCSFPLALSESLITTALKNIEALIGLGVQRLTIGYCTVYDYNEVIKENDNKAALKKFIRSSDLKQQLHSLLMTSQGTTEQLLVSQSVQLLNSEEEAVITDNSSRLNLTFEIKKILMVQGYRDKVGAKPKISSLTARENDCLQAGCSTQKEGEAGIMQEKVQYLKVPKNEEEQLEIQGYHHLEAKKKEEAEKDQEMKKMHVQLLHKLIEELNSRVRYEMTLTDYGIAKLQQGVEGNSSGTVMPGNAASKAPIPDQHSLAMDVYSTLCSPYGDDSLRSTRHQHPILRSRIEMIAF